MSQFLSQPMTREAALRIGLAARELKLAKVNALVVALAGKLGLPLTESKLAGVAVSDLREIFAQASSVNRPAAQGRTGSAQQRLKSAVRLLWGEGVEGSELPAVDPYRDGELPGSIRVACASNSDENIDGHFGSCERFLIYQVSASALRLIAVRPTLAADHAEDRNAGRAQLIADCQVVYVQSIGGPAAAKVVRVGAHPVKLPQAGAARLTLARLQAALSTPPPWLAKAMGVPARSLERYAAVMAED